MVFGEWKAIVEESASRLSRPGCCRSTATVREVRCKGIIMRRADRLFEIIQRLRRHRVVTARSLAEQFDLSERTIYRDIRDLIASRVPIEAAAGVGYSLRKGYDLPPLMFSERELEALRR